MAVASASKSAISSFGDISLMRTYHRMMEDTTDPVSVIKFCQDYGLVGSKYICPVCTKPMQLAPRADSTDKITWKCSCTTSRVKRSIRLGTCFSGSNLPITKILLVSCCWASKSSLGFIAHQCEVARSTVTHWANFCREVCLEIFLSEMPKIGGPGTVVEIDESKFGKRKFNRGKRVEGKWVFSGYERGTGRCFIAPVENRSRDTLLQIITDRILPGTTLMSDCWKAYDCLSHQGFIDLTVNHCMTFKDPVTGALVNANGTWGAVKRGFQGSNKIKDQFDSYLAEYVWRKSSVSPAEKMLSFFEMCSKLYPPQEMDPPPAPASGVPSTSTTFTSDADSTSTAPPTKKQKF